MHGIDDAHCDLGANCLTCSMEKNDMDRHSVTPCDGAAGHFGMGFSMSSSSDLSHRQR